MDREEIWQEFIALPPEAQRQVIDFIAFLRTRHPRPGSRKKSKQTSLADEPFIGMWHDREDMQDSGAWVRSVREQEWMRPNLAHPPPSVKGWLVKST